MVNCVSAVLAPEVVESVWGRIKEPETRYKVTATVIGQLFVEDAVPTASLSAAVIDVIAVVNWLELSESPKNPAPENTSE